MQIPLPLCGIGMTNGLAFILTSDSCVLTSPGEPFDWIPAWDSATPHSFSDRRVAQNRAAISQGPHPIRPTAGRGAGAREQLWVGNGAGSGRRGLEFIEPSSGAVLPLVPPEISSKFCTYYLYFQGESRISSLRGLWTL